MIKIFKKIGFFFAKKIHLSKIKVLLTIPLILAIIASITLEIDFEKYFLKFSKDSSPYGEFLTLCILIVILIIIDLIHDRSESNKKGRKMEIDAKVLADPNISEELKEKFLSKYE
ncbi:hypothetical protein ACNR9Q_00445 [Maribacter sp. X9]|uniref:hypothetical protein n=1 Tax=Maribacter sp. X9 TaxID=3402159 RepID=UPI003AF36572